MLITRKNIFWFWWRVRWYRISCKKIYSVKFRKSRKKFYLSLHYDRANSYLSLNNKEIIKFKAKYSEIVATPLYLGNISKKLSAENMRNTELYWDVYNFSIDFDAIAVADTLDTQKYLMKKNGVV